MKLNQARGSRLLIGGLFGLLAVFVFARMITGLYVDILWFDSVGYSDVFWRRAFWTWGVRGAGMVLVAGVVYANLKYVARTLGGIRIKRRLGDLEISEQLPKGYISMAVGTMSILLGLWFGASIPRSIGLGVLFLTTGADWGMVDPVLGQDLLFYMLALPIVSALVTFGMVLVFLCVSLSAAGYAATGALSLGKRNVQVESGPRKHLAILVATFFALLAVRFYLQRYFLLLDGSSSVEGIFGYTDAMAGLPGLRIVAVLSAFTAIGALWSGLKDRALPFLTTFGGLIVGGLVAGQLYPAFVQRFQVEPNELVRETPYIEHAIDFTQLGYDLREVERRAFEFSADAGPDWAFAREQFEGLPVWNEDALIVTFREIEARRRYYEFGGVTIDRYTGPDGPVPVALAVREIEPSGIEDPNWQNLHLRDTYVAGLGVVAGPANRKTAEGRVPFFLSDIPVQFDAGSGAPPGLRLERPGVFFGTLRSRIQPYVIITPEAHLKADGAPGEPGVDIPHGIGLDSGLRKAAFSWHFQDLNLLFAREVAGDSRLVFERQVIDRVRKISGDLIRFYESPYPVVSEGRVVWMVEGFVGSRWFPLSSSETLVGRTQVVRYIRNSVKITVDAVTGEVDFYVADTGDPLLGAYRAGFPSLFRDLSEMPQELQDHLRYPKVMLSIQAEVLKRYHQEEAPVFHQQQDLWQLPRELARSTTSQPYLPEYGLYALPGEDEQFLLTTAFVPDGRQNLAALLVARNDPERLGELILYEMPPGEQIAGPRQVEALVEQDPVISEQFSLWRTGGSEVWTGHLHIVPVGNTLLYMEAVYLAAEEDAIPEMRRLIVSDGRRVQMFETLDQAIVALAQASGDQARLPEQGGPVQDARPAADPTAPVGNRSRWPAEALELLDTAEERLRSGDFAGFGEALTELRALLRRLEGGGA